MFGRHGIAQDFETGRGWWDLALAQKHVKTMEYYENKIHIMRDNPSHGVAWLQSAAAQNHLRARVTLALAYEKRRCGLAQNYQQAVNGLNRQDGSREGQKQFRAQVERLRRKYIRQRELEIEIIKPKAAEGR